MTEKKILEKYTNTKNRPTLLPYIDDIKFLVDNDASQQAILDFLQIEKNVTVCKSTVSVFIKKHITKKSYKPPIKKEPTTENKEETTPKSKKKSLYLLD